MSEHQDARTDHRSRHTDEPDPVEGDALDPTAPRPEDGEVPPSGALPPDPTGLGALA